MSLLGRFVYVAFVIDVYGDASGLADLTTAHAALF